MKIAILSQLSPDALEWLQSHHDCSVVINPQSAEKSRLLADAEVVVLRSPVRLDAETLAQASRLQVIVRAGMGLDGIDVDAARNRGVKILTVPLSAQSVAEHTFALMLGLHRRIPWHHRMLQENRWLKHHGTHHDIHGKTLGLIGFGRIGIRTATIARGFEMEICAFDRSPEKPHKQSAAQRLGVRFSGLAGLLRESDVIAIQAPLDESTHHLIGAPQIALMKPGAFLINVGRGHIVAEDALFNALRNRRIAGAALDVFAQEPVLDHPLLTLDNFIGTPHIAGQTEEAQRRIGSEVVRIINAWAGKKPQATFQLVI
jgi:D-3-phosphoglycerate dehydrogenase / 2-oxoglutarate reductase